MNEDNALDQSIKEKSDAVAELAYQVKSEEIDEHEWQKRLFEILVLAYIQHWILGSRNQTISSDVSKIIESLLNSQLEYLNEFRNDLPELTISEVVSRSRMYISSSRQAYERGKTFPLELPAYPGDGTSECLTNCRCAWELQSSTGGKILAFWRLNEAEHCKTCVTRAGQWSPYILEG